MEATFQANANPIIRSDTKLNEMIGHLISAKIQLTVSDLFFRDFCSN